MLLVLNPTDPQFIHDEYDSEFNEDPKPKDNTLLELAVVTALGIGFYFAAKEIIKKEANKKIAPLGQA